MSIYSMDTLTGLFDNRELVKELKSSKVVNYFLINIDNFSSLNNVYGYGIGDKVLVEVANYLRKFNKDKAYLYRFCSDRFILLDKRNLNHEEICHIAESLLSFFSQLDITIDSIDFKISLTIGISTSIGLVNITQAEMAMKELRESRRNYYNIFNPLSVFIYEQQQDLEWIHKILDAIVEEKIVAYFQPIVNNKTKKIQKYECLARIKDEKEVISPFKFMKAAKETGNLAYVTKALIVQSFKKFSEGTLEFSINITDSDLNMGYLEDFLLKNAKRYKIEPSRVVLEILEHITSFDNNAWASQLQSLKAKGFQIALDDFGSENSNFSRLLEIEPDFLKIDGAFIKNIVTDKKSQVIVDAIIEICRALDIKIIAEHIHNKEVKKMVEALGIDFSQGFYFGEPSPYLVDET